VLLFSAAGIGIYVVSPHSVRVPRIAPVYTLVLVVSLIAGLGLLAPHIVASEEEPSGDYVVEQGDTLTDIATRFGTTVQALIDSNGLADPNHIVSGTELTVPSIAAAGAQTASTYEVEPGDTLWGIAHSLSISISALAQLNGLSADSQIIAGTELELPVSTASTVAMSSDTLPDRTHTVVAGETVSSIADDYGVSIAAILGANGLGDSGLIRVGQVLTIPAVVLPELSAETAAVLEDASAEFGIDRYLLMALSLMESGWQAGVVSHTGAIGLMQVMPDTAEWTVDYLLPSATNWHVSIEDNARVGAAYLNHLLFIEGGDVEGALASYYQGWGSYKADGMFDETRDYVDDVLALAGRLRSEGS
jgi:LysM repeat protein